MKTIFPATYSTLCPTALSSLISTEFNLKDVQSQLLVRGVGDTYLVETEDKRFILRAYRSSHRSLPQIKEEVALLLALKEADIRVSFPIETINGEHILSINAIEGERHAVLFSYAPGQIARLLNDRQLESLGSEMAKFHKVSATLNLGNARWKLDLDTMFSQPLEKLKPGYEFDPESYEWLWKIVEKAQKKLTDLGVSKFPTGYCHFDFLPKNFHFENDAITFFDFDFMGYGWLANDIMSFWQHLILDIFTGRMTKEAAADAYEKFLDAYKKQRQVSDPELAAMPYLAIGFWLFYMAFHRTHDQFYVFSQPTHVKAYTGIIRYIVDNYWQI